jgi:adenosylmethionine-8-amino-7-oxononanoate aminotransferase
MPDSSPSLAELDRAHLIHPITNFAAQEAKGPRIVEGGEGIRLRTRDGKQVIDGFSGLFNINVGHGRREIAEAVAVQMRRMPYYPSFWDFSNEPAIRLAERLVELLPADRLLDHFLFTTGGSDANETNFRIARLYHAVRGEPQRQKILSRRFSYHGITRAAGSATTLPAYHLYAAPDPLHVPTAAPYCFRCEFDATLPDCGLACVEEVEAVVEREGPDTVAAVIAEPVLGTGGIVPPPPEYFTHLQEVCARHGILLILDEVITGFGRTGRWFGMEHWNVRPDLVSFAKGITSGYLPLGGVAIGRHVYETIRDRSPQGIPFMVGLTYNNHPASCAAALANLEILEREDLVENSRQVGAYLLECLRQALGDQPFVAEIRGLGLLAALECVQTGTREPVGGKPMAYSSAVAQACWKRGLIVRALWENVALAPPLCIERSEVDELVGILAESMRDAAQGFPDDSKAAQTEGPRAR